MMPKSDLVGAVPAVKGHGIPAIRPKALPESAEAEKNFSVVVSKAIARTPEPVKIPEPTRAQSSHQTKPLAAAVIPVSVADDSQPTTAGTSKSKREQSAVAPLKTGDPIDASIVSAVMTAMVQPATASAIPQSRNSSKADVSDLAIESESSGVSSTAPTRQAVRFSAVAPVEERPTHEESPKESSSDIVTSKSAPETNPGIVDRPPGAPIAMNGKHKINDTSGLRSMQPVFPADSQKQTSSRTENSVNNPVALPQWDQSATKEVSAPVSRPFFLASAREGVLTVRPSPETSAPDGCSSGRFCARQAGFAGRIP